MQTTKQANKAALEQTSAPLSEATEIEANATLVDLGEHNLRAIYQDLIQKLENNMVADRVRWVDDYLATLVKHDEMTSLWTDPAFYRQLKRAVVDELLPIYDQYLVAKRRAEQKLQKGTWSRYCLWTIGICLAIEAVLSEGRVLRPQVLIPTAVLDGMLGFAIWCVANFSALSELRRTRKTLQASVEELLRKQQVSDQYEIFRSCTGGDLLKAELEQLLSSYSSPAEFWRDYYHARKADPTSREELESHGLDRFRNFLQLHVDDVYSAEAREQRFNALFLLAHKAFVLADRQHYVLQHLAPQNETKDRA
jgi:hypothetical protein